MQERNGAAPGRVRLFGQVQSNEAYQIRDLLTRSVVAFDWTELRSDEDCRRELGLALTEVRLPVVELPDGSTMSAPSLRELADRLGWVTQPKLREYDLSIYGAGPAGLSAAVYAASEGVRVLYLATELDYLVEAVRAEYYEPITTRILRGDVLWAQFEEAVASCRADLKRDDRQITEKVNELAVTKVK